MRLLSTLLFSSLIVTAGIAQTRVSASEIIDKINNGQNVTYKNVTITGDLDLTDLNNRTQTDREKKWWGSDYAKYESTVEVALNFENCTFDGDVLAYYHEESDNETFLAHFEKDVTFRNCTFKEASEFKYSEFDESVEFYGSTFDEEANFKYAEFDEAPVFTRAVFGDDANFKYAEFPDETSFAGAVFHEEANFKYAEFPGGASFSEARFLELANFKYIKFSNPLNMKNVKFEGSEDFKYTEVDGQSFTAFLLKNQ